MKKLGYLNNVQILEDRLQAYQDCDIIVSLILSKVSFSTLIIAQCLPLYMLTTTIC